MSQKNFFTRILIFLLALTIAGCAETHEPIPTLPPPATLPPVTATKLPPTETPTTIISPLCFSEPINISEKVVSAFYWSEDGSKIIFQQKDDPSTWYAYGTSRKETQSYIPTANVSADETIQEFGLIDYVDFFLSPSKQHVLFSKETQQGYLIYAKTLGDKETQYLGEVLGKIDKADWFEDENKVIISIDWQSPLGVPEASIYLVDLLQSEIEIVIPHPWEYSDVSYLGKTLDDENLLLTSYAEPKRVLRLFNMQNEQISSTTVLPPLAYQWIPDEDNRFIAFGYLDAVTEPTLYVYDLQTLTEEVLLDYSIMPHPYIKDAIKISPNLDGVVYIDYNDENLYWIDCEFDK